MPKLSTMRDVAREVGCGTMTVSRALRGLPNVNATLRERIIEAAEKLGYRSDPLVSSVMGSLGRKREETFYGTFAWLNLHKEQDVWQEDPLLNAYRNAAARRCVELNLALDDIWLGDPEMTAKRAKQIIQARSIIGVVVTGGPRPRHHLSLNLDGIAVVSIGGHVVRPQLHRVGTHTFANAIIALRKLRHLGYERIGFSIVDWLDLSGGGILSGAYLSFQQSLPARQRLPILHCPQRDPTEMPAFEKWLKRHRPDCILCVAGQMVQYLALLGYRVPQDIGVAHLNLAGDVADWAGIDIQKDRIGRTAIDLLLQLVQKQEFGAPKQHNEIFVTGVWKTGKTAIPQREKPGG